MIAFRMNYFYHNMFCLHQKISQLFNYSSVLSLDAEMKYIHDKGFKVLTMAELEYNDESNYQHAKEFEEKTVEKPVSYVTSSIRDAQRLKRVFDGQNKRYWHT